MSSEETIYQVKFKIKQLFHRNIEYYLPIDKPIRFNIEDNMFFKTSITDEQETKDKIELSIFVIFHPSPLHKKNTHDKGLPNTQIDQNMKSQLEGKAFKKVSNDTIEQTYEKDAEIRVRRFLSLCSLLDENRDNSPIMIDLDPGGTRYIKEQDIGNTFQRVEFPFGWKYEITPEKKQKKFSEFIRFLEQSRTMHTLLKNKNPDFYYLSLEYYYRSRITEFTFNHFAILESKIESSFLDLVMCLECLFNEGVGDIAYKIALRASFVYMLFRDNKNSDQVFNFFTKMYKQRNNIIHGTKKSQVTEEEIETLHKYLKIIILTYFTIIHTNFETKSKADVVKIIDKAILDFEQKRAMQIKIVNLIKNKDTSSGKILDRIIESLAQFFKL